MYVVVAAILQAIGGLVACLVFLSFVWNAYIELARYHRMDPEMWRAGYWVLGPIALILSIAVGVGNRRARRYSRGLCVLYPVGPTLDVLTLKSSLHGGEVFLVGMAVVGALGGLAIWILLRPSTLAAV
jgi:hypothetical protein